MTDVEREQLKDIATGVTRIETKLDDHIENHKTTAAVVRWIVGAAIAISAVIVGAFAGCV